MVWFLSWPLRPGAFSTSPPGVCRCSRLYVAKALLGIDQFLVLRPHRVDAAIAGHVLLNDDELGDDLGLGRVPLRVPAFDHRNTRYEVLTVGAELDPVPDNKAVFFPGAEEVDDLAHVVALASHVPITYS